MDTQPESSADSGNSTMTTVSIIIPVVLALGVSVWGILILLGIIHHRRLRLDSSSSSQRSRTHYNDIEKVALLCEPQLLEIHLSCEPCGDSIQDIHPLSVELLSSHSNDLISRGHRPNFKTSKPAEMREERQRRPKKLASRTGTTSKPAQMTVLVAMPSRYPDPHTQWNNCNIGTRSVSYTSKFEPEPAKVPELEKLPVDQAHDTSALNYYGTMEIGTVSYYLF
ncbi:hypothetical protein BC835DRAFT_1411670 [Cytidiella melzeri]|nr:hypothetical protein BC835DRAFT_1411670 [Cytidiella melzeri]